MPSPRLTPCETSRKRAGDHFVVENAGGDADRLHKRHCVRDQRRHSSGEACRFSFAESIAQERDAQPGAVPSQASGGS